MFELGIGANRVPGASSLSGRSSPVMQTPQPQPPPMPYQYGYPYHLPHPPDPTTRHETLHHAPGPYPSPMHDLAHNYYLAQAMRNLSYLMNTTSQLPPLTPSTSEEQGAGPGPWPPQMPLPMAFPQWSPYTPPHPHKIYVVPTPRSSASAQPPPTSSPVPSEPSPPSSPLPSPSSRKPATIKMRMRSESTTRGAGTAQRSKSAIRGSGSVSRSKSRGFTRKVSFSDPEAVYVDDVRQYPPYAIENEDEDEAEQADAAASSSTEPVERGRAGSRGKAKRRGEGMDADADTIPSIPRATLGPNRGSSENYGGKGRARPVTARDIQWEADHPPSPNERFKATGAFRAQTPGPPGSCAIRSRSVK